MTYFAQNRLIYQDQPKKAPPSKSEAPKAKSTPRKSGNFIAKFENSKLSSDLKGIIDSFVLTYIKSPAKEEYVRTINNKKLSIKDRLIIVVEAMKKEDPKWKKMYEEMESEGPFKDLEKTGFLHYTESKEYIKEVKQEMALFAVLLEQVIEGVGGKYQENNDVKKVQWLRGIVKQLIEIAKS